MSTLKVNTLEEATVGGATFYTAKAWVNFDHVTPVVRDSANVSSVTDDGTGELRVNLTNAMTDANYMSSGGCGDATHGAMRLTSTNDALGNTTLVVDCLIENLSGTQVNTEYVGISVIGNLA